jgi:two-component system, NtrC family, nitrogen regulation response regulator GlnG
MSQPLPTGWREALEQDTRPPDRAPRRRRRALVPGLTLLWHADPRRVGERAVLAELATGGAAPLSRTEPLFSPPGRAAAAPLADPHLSRRPLLLRGVVDEGVELDAAAAPTTVTIDGVPLAGRRRFSRQELDDGVVLLLAERVLVLLHRLHVVPPEPPRVAGLLGESPAILALRGEIARLAPLDLPVLLLGESGTGKELVARALHREGPFVAVNLAAIPPALAAAELFGAARGAYTGADRARTGYFRRADGGTLFLDEVGEAPPEVQPLLLRALEDGEVQPVGGEAATRSSARVVAATDADLAAAVATGRFRAPLYHRLAATCLRLPPLRRRRDDAARLLVHFLAEELDRLDGRARLAPAAPDDPPWLPAPLVARLVAAPWPGNVRQLRNVARRLAVDGAEAARVEPSAELEALLAGPAGAGGDGGEPAGAAPRHSPAAAPTDDEIRAALERHEHRVQAAARELGLSRGALYRRIEASPALRTGADLERAELVAALAAEERDVAAAARRLGVSQQALKRRMRALGLAGGAW